MIALKVAGMTCGGCAEAVRRAIVSRDPAAKVTVALGESRVFADTGLSAEEAVAAVEGAGYEAEVAVSG